MGQYHFIVNTTKKEYLDPHCFGHGLKLLEWSQSMGGTNTALAILLSNSNNRGGGDLYSDHPIIGTWANDNIVVAGDYAEKGDTGEPEDGKNLFTRCDEGEYKNVSYLALEAMLDDSYIREDEKKGLENCWNEDRKKTIQKLIKKVEKRIEKEREQNAELV
jgi:hypothetical protein